MSSATARCSIRADFVSDLREAMTSAQLAVAVRAVATTDAVNALAELATQLRRDHPADSEAETVARQAELKRRRVVQES